MQAKIPVFRTSSDEEDDDNEQDEDVGSNSEDDAVESSGQVAGGTTPLLTHANFLAAVLAFVHHHPHTASADVLSSLAQALVRCATTLHVSQLGVPVVLKGGQAWPQALQSNLTSLAWTVCPGSTKEIYIFSHSFSC
jgi:hypothetical protein